MTTREVARFSLHEFHAKDRQGSRERPESPVEPTKEGRVGTTVHDGLFSRPAEEWTDREIAVGLAQLAQRREELHWLAVVLADERDRRAAVYRDMADALLTGEPARIVDDDDKPDNDAL